MLCTFLKLFLYEIFFPNSEYPNQTPCLAASQLGLHYLSKFCFVDLALTGSTSEKLILIFLENALLVFSSLLFIMPLVFLLFFVFCIKHHSDNSLLFSVFLYCFDLSFYIVTLLGRKYAFIFLNTVSCWTCVSWC